MKKSQKAILITAIFLLSTFGLSMQAAAKTKDAPSQDYYPFSGKWGLYQDIEHQRPLGITRGVFDHGRLYAIIHFDYHGYGILSARYKDYHICGTLRIFNGKSIAYKEPLESVLNIEGNFHFYNPYSFTMNLNIDCEDYGYFKMMPQCIWMDGFST